VEDREPTLRYGNSPLTSDVIIPARLASTRLPEKLLLRETGKTVLQHTYEAASRARLPRNVLLAVDDRRLADEALGFGATAIMTNPLATCGTERVAEVARTVSDADILVNVQADEPDIHGADIDLVIELLQQHPAASVATLASPIRSLERLLEPARVKVVVDGQGAAAYFSRSPIPFVRDGWDTVDWEGDTPFLQHLGIYAYRREFLLKLHELPPSPLEQLERLEQLRFLAAGHAIQVGVVPECTAGIDTADDYRQFVLRRAG
jgi:3-deoxy-manno-octulosonate cytidylyltransferase (CMP-KDO synthetase)